MADAVEEYPASGAPDLRFPARCPAATHLPGTPLTNEERVCLRGRLTTVEKGKGTLSGEWGAVRFCGLGNFSGVCCGDLVSLEGYVDDGVLVVEQVNVLAPTSIPWGTRQGDWERFAARGGRLRDNLRRRAAVLEAVRVFFKARGFLEVETPALVHAPSQELHLQLFETQFHHRGRCLPAFLVASPELQMKRLLGSGFERLFQIGRCFRNGERSALHNPEFTMLEWYRAYAGYEEIMQDVEALVTHVADVVCGAERIEYQGKQIDLKAPWSRITVDQAFARWANVELRACPSAAALRRRARFLGYGSVTEQDSWEDVFFKLLIEKVEPALRRQGAVFLKDYPACMASLAKLKVDDAVVAERVEAYVAGVELANGFTELNDPEEQRQRFVDERRRRLEAGFSGYPLDEEFLQMLEQGMPPAGGMALGIDRLVMLLTDAATIDEVIAFPFSG